MKNTRSSGLEMLKGQEDSAQGFNPIETLENNVMTVSPEGAQEAGDRDNLFLAVDRGRCETLTIWRPFRTHRVVGVARDKSLGFTSDFGRHDPRKSRY
jgi:hypothetical protein